MVTNKAFSKALLLPTNKLTRTEEVLVQISVGVPTGLTDAFPAFSHSLQECCDSKLTINYVTATFFNASPFHSLLTFNHLTLYRVV